MNDIYDLIPKMPDTNDIYNPTDQYTSLYGTKPQGIFETIKASGTVPGMSETALPSILSLLTPGGQAASGYEQAINKMTDLNVGAAQSDAMRRGITGSDIEAANMTGARIGGQQSMANMYSNLASQASNMIYNAAFGDINTHRQTLLMLAQSMGQELSSERDIQMFQESLRASMEMAADANRSNLIGSVLGAGAQMGSAALMPRPMPTMPRG